MGKQDAVRLAGYASGICFCYWYFGVLQEQLLTSSPLGATFVLVCSTFFNSAVACIWGFIVNSKKERDGGRLHYPLLFLSSSAYVLAMSCSNEALRYVSYPTNVLAKSCKLIPTMVIGSFVDKKSYSIQQWFSALLISGGISLFHTSRIQHDLHQSDEEDGGNDGAWKGIVLLSTSLLMDGCLGATQTALKQTGGSAATASKSNDNNAAMAMSRKSSESTFIRPPTAVESMFWINFYAFLLLVPVAQYRGQLTDGVRSLQRDRALATSIAILNGVVSIGQIFIFLTISNFSPIICTTITTTRKFFTVLFSVIYFGHKFSILQWVSVGLVFGGLYLNIMTSNRKTTDTKKKEE